MDEWSPDELDSIVEAIETESSPPRGSAQGHVSKVSFSPLEGEKPRPLEAITEKERARFGHLKASIEVVYGKKKVTLKELGAFEEGSLIPLDDLSDDLVEIYANGALIGRGEVVAVNGYYGVKIVSLS